MMPFSVRDNAKLGFINALFTATSAVCVTGLIVVDTATMFSIYGKTIIMILIQIGGLGIMILSSFAAFLIGKKISHQEKLTISYILSDNDMQNLSQIVKSIILITFLTEFIGAVLLFTNFKNILGLNLMAVFFSVFHSISAFCNAGFALFSNNLENFKSYTVLNLIIASLIIIGGLGFSVTINLYQYLIRLIEIKIFKKKEIMIKLNLNTKVVIIITAILIITGTLIIYILEHKTTLLSFDIKTQYLCSFFQSVTLRTAGFNTINISLLTTPTWLIMILFMFIGGASGSTAGGIKVNTIAVLFAYLKSILKDQDDIVLFKQSLTKKIVNQSLLIIIVAITVIFLGIFILSINENKKLIKMTFEVVSAFGTVGLSTGITSELSHISKIIIIVTMLIGRVGLLTLITALSQQKGPPLFKYPEGNIMIG